MPKVSVGLPIYNGENFVEQALKSLLTQSFKDFELIISDNGSTDKTQEICQAYADLDPRIHYHRSNENQGASWNFNNVVELASGDFFMWAAHDDKWDSQYIESCANILSQNTEVVLCYTATQEINVDDEITRKFSIKPKLGSSKPHERFGASWRYPPQIPVFGLIRMNALRKTRLIGNFTSSDRALVCHLALLGPFYGIEDFLFFYRRHAKQSTGGQYRNKQELIEWYDPRKRGKLNFPMWRFLKEHIVSVKSVPLSIKETVLCYLSILRWMVRYRWRLLNNVILRS